MDAWGVFALVGSLFFGSFVGRPHVFDARLRRRPVVVSSHALVTALRKGHLK